MPVGCSSRVREVLKTWRRDEKARRRTLNIRGFGLTHTTQFETDFSL